MTNKIKFTEKKKILWIDDDINKPALEPDRDELERRNCTIIDMIDPDGFMKEIKNSNECINGFPIDCFIIDAMMPHGNYLSLKETKNTTRTGLVLIKKLFDSRKFQNVPVIVYSVLDEEEIMDFCSEHGIPLDRVTILNKSLKPREFADKIVEILLQ